MRIGKAVMARVRCSALGARLADDSVYRTVGMAVMGLCFNLIFAFYNGILGVLSHSVAFLAAAVYELILSAMRLYAVVQWKRYGEASGARAAAAIGVMLVILAVFYHAVVLLGMRYASAAIYGTIPMIAIATFTFSKITRAAVTAHRQRRNPSRLLGAVNAIRYSEVAVSLLTMQQSMLVSFGDGGDRGAVILNACTGAGVCMFILVMGILTLKNGRKEIQYGKIEADKSE